MRDGNDVIGIRYDSSCPGTGGSQVCSRPPPPVASAARVFLPTPGVAIRGATPASYLARKRDIIVAEICERQGKISVRVTEREEGGENERVGEYQRERGESEQEIAMAL